MPHLVKCETSDTPFLGLELVQFVQNVFSPSEDAYPHPASTQGCSLSLVVCVCFFLVILSLHGGGKVHACTVFYLRHDNKSSYMDLMTFCGQ